MTEVYAFRLKPSNIDRVGELLIVNQIAIGWSRAASLLDLSLSEKEFRKALDLEYPDLERSGRDFNHLWRFLRDLKIGDIVVVPHGDDIYFTRVSSDPFYRSDMIIKDTAIRRDVLPLFGGTPMYRRRLPQAIQDSLRFRETSKHLPDVRLDVLSLLAEEIKRTEGDIASAALFAAGRRRAELFEESIGFSHFAPQPEKFVDRRHAKIWRDLRVEVEKRGYDVSNKKIGSLGPDLFTIGGNPDLLFEIKTGSGASDYLKAIGQLLVYEKVLEQIFRKLIVLPERPPAKLLSILHGLGIDVVSFTETEDRFTFEWGTA